MTVSNVPPLHPSESSPSFQLLNDSKSSENSICLSSLSKQNGCILGFVEGIFDPDGFKEGVREKGIEGLLVDSLELLNSLGEAPRPTIVGFRI